MQKREETCEQAQCQRVARKVMRRGAQFMRGARERTIG